jgi:hypothetical protein
VAGIHKRPHRDRPKELVPPTNATRTGVSSHAVRPLTGAVAYAGMRACPRPIHTRPPRTSSGSAAPRAGVSAVHRHDVSSREVPRTPELEHRRYRNARNGVVVRSAVGRKCPNSAMISSVRGGSAG